QLSAIISCIIRNIAQAVKDPAEFGIDQNLQKDYEKLKQIYNNFYSSLNNAAAKLYWKPLEGVKDVIAKIAKDYDLYVASGIIQEILEKDFEHHGFEKRFFSGIFGSNPQGDMDKASILKKIKSMGYRDVLFIGDSRKDFEYAHEARVKFFKVKTGDDYNNLLLEIKNGLPDQIDVCEFTDEEIMRIRSKVPVLMKLYASGKRPSFEQITTFINTGNF
ncbi:MAG: HAD hydrolase-like protein, partial [Candidatus Omnitrophica bacterium]|nr:HAD hydrolase-like protein [Candidatus Omnitrophota bacterium]